jgi:PAS domain S-box-containing protein
MEKQLEVERKRMEQLLRLREAALEAAANAIIITDADGLIEWANPAFSHLTGYSLEEILGRTPSFLKSGIQDEAFYRAMWEAIRAGSVWRGELVNRRKDGTLYSDEMTVTPVRFGTGAISHFIAVKQDITERKHLGEELLRAKHFETIGMIAGGVAHEVRNPLFAISTIIAALERKLADRPEFGEYVRHIQDQTRRLNALMNDLLLLGRPVEGSVFVPVGLGEVLRQSLDLAGRSAFGECPCVLEPSLEPLMVMGTAEKLVQAFLNLIQNALSFTPIGGRALVRAWREAEQAVVTVRDEGPGISAGLLPHLFQPFQTERKGGTGLGLAIVRHIVAAHGGTVEAVNNDPPPGATFTVRLPVLGGGVETGEAGRV